MTDVTDTNIPLDNITRIIEDRKVTFGYTRKLSDGNYGSEEASLYISERVPDDEDIQSWLDSHHSDYDTVLKAQVWTALGLEFSITEEGKARLESKPAAWQTQAGARRGGGNGTTAGVTQLPRPPQPPAARPTARPGGDQPAQLGHYADMPGFCKDCGGREFYDNRADMDKRITDRKPLGPDWTCKSCRKGVFRPGSFQYKEWLDASAGREALSQAPPGAAITQPAAEWGGPPDEAPF